MKLGKHSLKRETIQDHLLDRLHRRIGGGTRGFRLPTEKYLADELEVSVPTVRKALEVLATQDLIEQKEGRGWSVTDKAMDRRIAIVCDLDLTRLRHPRSMLDRIQTVRRMLEEADYDVSIYLGDSVSLEAPPASISCKQFVKDLKTRGFAGIVAVWAFPDESWMPIVKARQIPIVGFGVFYNYGAAYHVEAYIRRALTLTKKHGMKRVAFLDSISHWKLDNHDHKRKSDFPKWVSEAGLETIEPWVRQDWHPSLTGANWESFRELWTSSSVRPEVIILNSSRQWKEVEKALSSLNLKVPGDLSIIMPTERNAYELMEHLPVVKYIFDGEAMSRRVGELMLSLLRGQAINEPHKLVDAWEVVDSHYMNKDGDVTEERIHPVRRETIHFNEINL